MFFVLIVSSCSYDDTGIWNSINNLEQRVVELEKTCKEINSNISAMQAILTALQNNDYVTSIVQVTENGKTIGYTINFSKSGSVTIYHGENGKDGANGADGKDGVDGKNGYTPVIGVRQDTDGIYYWTLDGEWLTDENGNKIKAIGTDGKDGVNGTDGKDGADGKDGVNGADGKDGADGITPQLKIENDYWYISYDNGATWTILDKATGADGKDGVDGVDGVDGKDGVDGDSFFSSVTFDDKYIYLTLSDGTEIVVPMADSSSLANLKSVVFIPRYSDGKATISVYNNEAVAEFDVMVAPASLASIIAENYESMLTISAVQTETRAANLINMPVISCTSDDNGIISITASANKLDLMKDNYAILTISDGKNSITSESVEMMFSNEYVSESADFTIEVTDVDTISAGIKITPSKDSLYFCWRVMEYDGKSTSKDIMLRILGSYVPTYRGIQDYTGGPGSPYKYKLDVPDTEYCVIAFGYISNYGVTTDPVMVTFRTLPAPDASETEFNMTASAVTPYSLKIGVTSSVASTYYTPGVCKPEEYNEEVLVSEVEAGIAEILEMQQTYDPNITLSQVLGMYFYKGNYTIDASGMQPETTIMGYIFAIDHKTGKVAKVQTFENLATTRKPGDVTPTVEFIGNYSGNDENGQVLGDANLTKGKAISVFKYSNLDGARSLFTTLLGDNLMNYTDPELWKMATGYWDTCSMSQPYGFYVTDWNYEHTALAYAVDSATGQPGGIGRATTKPTINNKNDIQELIDLVNELNAAQKSSFSVPQSIVVSEGISLSAVKVEPENNVSIHTK